MGRILLLIGLITIPFCDILSQDKGLVFTRIDREAGLQSNIVSQVIKDHQGITWFATNSGLHWYDGQRMIIYENHLHDSSSLPDNSVLLIKEDKYRRLWAITESGPAMYDRIHNNFLRIPVDTLPPKRSTYTGLYEDSKGTIWLTTYEGGPYFYDSTMKRFEPHNRVWPQSFSQIHSMVEDPSTGQYWVSTNDGLALYDPLKRIYYHNKNNPFSLPCFNDTTANEYSSSLYINSNCELWLSGRFNDQEYYFRYNTKKKELLRLNHSSLHYTQGFFTDASGTTWAWGDHLSSFDPKTNSLINIPEKRNDRTGIDFDIASGMYEDNENNLWISSNTGAFVFNPQQQEFHTVEVWSNRYGQPVDRNVYGFIGTRDKIFIALGAGGDGLFFFDENFKRIPNQYGYSVTDTRDENYQVTYCGLQDSEGLIWVGCESGKLMIIDPLKKTTKYLNPSEFAERNIRCMAEDQQGNIWFGTINNVIVKWVRSENKFKQIIPFRKGKYRFGSILQLIPGNRDDIWAGTFVGGLARFDIHADSLIQQFLPDKKSNEPLMVAAWQDLVLYNKDTILITTGNGIEVFDMNRGQFTNITERDGLNLKNVVGLAVDEEKNIWLSTMNGIAKMRLPQKQITRYGFRDGITNEAFTLGTFQWLPSGIIVIGNTHGFVYFDPRKVNAVRRTPDARITGLSVFNKAISIDSIYKYGNKLQLNYDQNSITIRFSAMTYRMNDKLDFYYQLEGADKNWIKAAAIREINYSNLGSGNYLFKVKSISKDGTPSEKIATLSIRIIPPFWDTWWFYLLVAAAIGGLLYFIYKLRVNRLLAVEKVRRRVARDLHDDMGSTLSTINILSEMARMKIRNDVDKTSEYIVKISDNSSRMMEAIDDIVWSINPMNDSMQKIMARMREFATSVLEAKDIDIDFKAAGEVNHLTLDMEARRDFFLIFKEAINNAAKYSKCKHLSISIHVAQKRLLLDIMDDGIGFDVNVVDNGNGLINMRKRADSLKGNIVINSNPGMGTQVSLNVPV